MGTELYREAARLLPARFKNVALEREKHWGNSAEEFRLRAGREATVLLPEGERPLLPDAAVFPDELEEVLEKATYASLHSHMESLRRGFVTTASGCRIGVCGTAAVSAGEITGLRSWSSLCLRIPGQHRGCADGVYPALCEGGFRSALLLSPPGGGKTTLLRELVRRLSEDGLRVSVADERGELAACFEGRPRFELGPHTDVMTGGSKAGSMMMLLRAMSPQVLALDEITAEEDILACEQAAHCGVLLLASAHAHSPEDLRERPLYRRLLEGRLFARCVVIRREGPFRRMEVRSLF